MALELVRHAVYVADSGVEACPPPHFPSALSSRCPCLSRLSHVHCHRSTQDSCLHQVRRIVAIWGSRHVLPARVVALMNNIADGYGCAPPLSRELGCVCVCVSALPLECNVECVGVRHVPPNARLGFASVDIPEAELEVRAAAVCAAVCAFRHTVHTTLGVMLCRCQLRLSTYRRHLCGWTDSTVRGHGCWTASPCTHPEAYLIRSCPCSLLTVHRRSKPVVS